MEKLTSNLCKLPLPSRKPALSRLLIEIEQVYNDDQEDYKSTCIANNIDIRWGPNCPEK